MLFRTFFSLRFRNIPLNYFYYNEKSCRNKRSLFVSLLLIEYWRRTVWIKNWFQKIIRVQCYKRISFFRMMFILELFSVFFFIFGKACFNRTYVSIRLRLWLAFNSYLVCEDSIKVIVQLYKRFPISGGII